MTYTGQASTDGWGSVSQKMPWTSAWSGLCATAPLGDLAGLGDQQYLCFFVCFRSVITHHGLIQGNNAVQHDLAGSRRQCWSPGRSGIYPVFGHCSAACAPILQTSFPGPDPCEKCLKCFFQTLKAAAIISMDMLWSSIMAGDRGDESQSPQFFTGCDGTCWYRQIG